MKQSFKPFKLIAPVLLFAITCVLLFTGCKKDTEEFIPNNESYQSATLVGYVVDENDNPINNAIVYFKDKSTLTDQYGIYKFSNTQVSSQHNVIEITKAGYFDGSRVFRSDISQVINHTTKLKFAKVDYSFEANNGGTFTDENVELIFSNNSVVIESTGQDYQGLVNVSVDYIDPTDNEIRMTMPGDLSARTIDGSLVTLNSFGMVGVRLTAINGAKLQIKEGSTVQMKAKIPEDLKNEAPAEIPMWHYNQDLGLWEEEGIANLNGDYYTANVAHFSFWNYDISFESVIAKGRILNRDGDAVSTAFISIHIANQNSGGHGTVYADGTFNGRVPKNQPLDIRIYYTGVGCKTWEIIYSKTISATNADIDLGDIIVDEPIFDVITIKGVLLDCNGNKVTDGYVKVGQNLIVANNGSFNATLKVCNAGSLEFEAIDRTNNKSSSKQNLASPGNHDLGNITLCEQGSYITVVSNGIGLDTTFIDDINIKNQQTLGKYISASLLSTANDSFSSAITLNYDDTDPNDFKTGTFQLTSGTYAFIHQNITNKTEPGYYYLANGQTGTIDVKNVTSELISGTYEFTATNEIDQNDTQTITGEFYIKR